MRTRYWLVTISVLGLAGCQCPRKTSSSRSLERRTWRAINRGPSTTCVPRSLATRAGLRVSMNCFPSSWYAWAGNVEASEGSLREFSRLPASSEGTSFFDGIVTGAKADLYEARGVLQDAQKARPMRAFFA